MCARSIGTRRSLAEFAAARDSDDGHPSALVASIRWPIGNCCGSCAPIAAGYGAHWNTVPGMFGRDRRAEVASRLIAGQYRIDRWKIGLGMVRSNAGLPAMRDRFVTNSRLVRDWCVRNGSAGREVRA